MEKKYCFCNINRIDLQFTSIRKHGIMESIRIERKKIIDMSNHVLDEAKRCLQCKEPQCQKGCPASTDIREVIRLFKENRIEDAGDVVTGAKTVVAAVEVSKRVAWDLDEFMRSLENR